MYDSKGTEGPPTVGMAFSCLHVSKRFNARDYQLNTYRVTMSKPCIHHQGTQ